MWNRRGLLVAIASCGAPLQALAQQTRGRRRPLWLVGALTFVTFGVYLVIWVGVTWSEMKRELRDEGMRPVWHALGLLVPIYNSFGCTRTFV
jgi:hypothetical protein